jgi:phosphoserine phosphatase
LGQLQFKKPSFWSKVIHGINVWHVEPATKGQRLKEMRKLTIIWDFDGTILPSTPFDSEQSLLLYRMNQRDKPFGWLKKGYAKAIMYADQRERFRKTFKKSYIRLLKGTPSSTLDEACCNLAHKILPDDRLTLKKLKNDGYRMIVLSCGTVDLSERILRFAGIEGCFDLIEGNRFQFDEDRVAGMHLRLPDPDDKLAMMNKLNLSPERTIVVGDGYTDLPLLNWSSIPVMIDRTGKKKKRFTSNNFHFITSTPEIMNIIQETVT